MNSSYPTSVRFAITLIVSALLAPGCSSSSKPDDSGDNRPPDVIAVETSNGSEVESTPAVPDPAVRNSTRVDFEITVPAYVSDALQIVLEWSVRDEPGTAVSVSGTWVGDEYWTASDDFPTDTEHLLIVTFFDRNSDITLGRLETEFRTGTNASESIRIEADRFDVSSWDDDGDGVINIDELIAGTDPSVDETAGLALREAYHDESITDALFALRRVSESYESSIPEQRPYNEDTEQPQTEFCLSGDLGMPISRIIDIDESGAGSFSENFFCDAFDDVTHVDRVATRTSIDGSVMWSGTYLRTNSSAGVYDRIGFSTETETIKDQTHRQVGTIDREFLQNYQATQDISYSLTGEVIDGTFQCEPIAGTITNDQQDNYVAITTITKQPGNRYWRVSVANDGQIVDEYLVQSLGTTFYCDFGA